MTKFFPFPLLRGNLPRTSDAVFEQVQDDANVEILEDQRFKRLQPNSDLVHLLTVKCSAKLSAEQEITLRQGQPMRLKPRYSHKLVLSYVPRTGSRRYARLRTTTIDANPLDPETEFSSISSQHCDATKEFFYTVDDQVMMEFVDDAGQVVDLGRDARFWDLGLGSSGDDQYGHALYARVPFQLSARGSNDLRYFKLKNGASLDHLAAYIWYEPEPQSKSQKAPKNCAYSDDESSSDEEISVLGLAMKLSFYWDTTRSYLCEPAKLSRDGSAIKKGIFRYHQDLNDAMKRQNDMILRVAHKMRSDESVKEEIRNVADEEPHPNPEDFKLTLYDYQARTLTWMIRQEENPYAMSCCLLTSHDGQKSISLEDGEPVTSNIEQKLFGGILADNTGVGKTISVLALMKARPLDRSRLPQADLKEYDDGKLIVKATLVICPSNLVNQWEFEFHKSVANGGRILKITSIVQARRFTMEDVHEADLIVMSHSFLSNKNFFNQKNSLKVKYLALKYRRIVVDEFHELLDSLYNSSGDLRSSSQAFQVFNDLDSYSKFGLTGTPNYHLISNISRTGRILNINVPNSKGYTALFKKHYVRRSVPDLQLPPVIYEEIDVVLKPAERAIYQSLGNNTRAAILLCSHFDMEQYEEANSGGAEEVLQDAAGNELLSVHDVAIKIQAGRRAAVARKTKELANFKKTLTEMRDNEEEYTQYEVANVTRNINALTEEIAELKGEHAFFDNVLQTLKNRSEQECNICLNEFGRDDPVALTRCGHIFCNPCIERSLQLKPMCPICRRPVSERSIYKVSADEVDAEDQQPATVPSNSRSAACGNSSANPIVLDLSDDENQNPNFPPSTAQKILQKREDISEEEEEMLDQRFYGSKLTKMAAYIRSLFSSDPNARVLLFVQFTPLSKLVSSALNALGIQNSFVFGNIFARNNAIDKFRSNQVRVIMLSAETSVTGLQLTEATHVVLLHPFYFSDGQDDRATAAEKQGVARAYRLGLDHELKVVRFVVKNTVEEEILSRRPRLPI